MTGQQLQVKEKIVSLLKDTNRSGIDRVIDYLNRSDFFTASCHSHHQIEGGLALHSLGVYEEVSKLKPNIPDESVRIATLLHDLCSSHLHGYNYIGKGHHGKRSVMLLEKLHFELLPNEYLAICNHMHHVTWKKKGDPFNVKAQLWYNVNKYDRIDAAKYPGVRRHQIDDR